MNIEKFYVSIKHHYDVIEKHIQDAPISFKEMLHACLDNINHRVINLNNVHYNSKEGLSQFWNNTNDIMISMAIEFCYIKLLDWYPISKIQNHSSRYTIKKRSGDTVINEVNYDSLHKYNFETLYNLHPQNDSFKYMRFISHRSNYCKMHCAVPEMFYSLIQKNIPVGDNQCPGGFPSRSLEQGDLTLFNYRESKLIELFNWGRRHGFINPNSFFNEKVIKCGYFNLFLSFNTAPTQNEFAKIIRHGDIKFIKTLFGLYGLELFNLSSIHYSIHCNRADILELMFSENILIKLFGDFLSQYPNGIHEESLYINTTNFNYTIRSSFKYGNITVMEWCFEHRDLIPEIAKYLPTEIHMAWAEKYNRTDLLELGQRYNVFPMELPKGTKMHCANVFFYNERYYQKVAEYRKNKFRKFVMVYKQINFIISAYEGMPDSDGFRKFKYTRKHHRNYGEKLWDNMSF
ncbi:MAG: hypothetical protein JKX76_02370 [Colwellia sp.]|nr:hypothetical protein [Colwellia sp.]